ncbi:MAG: tRNA uridine-5-carboxymethylaminomethyl(34) synthesis GTPase MnmE [marine benthic group bacterium]|nr:tRNA uridine-5-carboxymethylaminomethyl(34) synthesis GTPase MnmE [Gemmatimonadota bacterium]
MKALRPEADPVQETIAAIATAPGRGAIAVVRVSGPDTVQVARRLGLNDLPPRTALLRRLEHPEGGQPVDRVLAILFPAPASYTGEDLLEISSHGGTLLPQLVLDAVLAAGARLAEPGEFTRRAYLNGRIDLLQAEATADLIEAASPALAGAALHQLERGLSRRIESLRERMIEVQALLAYDIDFPEEDDGPLDRTRVDEALAALRDDLDTLLALAPEGEMLREGALTVIAGRPNAGKSSLFNSLVGFERAIVTEHPGTTRDAIEAVVGVEGYPFRLVDTAGLREASGAVEEIGIEVARSYLGRADIVLFCVESGRSLEPDEIAFLDEWPSNGRTTILVRTKADLRPAGELGPPADGDRCALQVELSAEQGEGIGKLRTMMLNAAWSGLRARPEAPLVTRRRHIRALESARSSIDEFSAACEASLPPEIAVTHLQDATVRLEELLGSVSTEDLLDRVFSSFCVGK